MHISYILVDFKLSILYHVSKFWCSLYFTPSKYIVYSPLGFVVVISIDWFVIFVFTCSNSLTSDSCTSYLLTQYPFNFLSVNLKPSDNSHELTSTSWSPESVDIVHLSFKSTKYASALLLPALYLYLGTHVQYVTSLSVTVTTFPHILFS